MLKIEPGQSVTAHPDVQQVASEMRTPRQAAAMLGCSEATVRYLAATGQLPCLRWGPQNERVFHVTDIEKVREAREFRALMLSQRSRRRYLETTA
jgi:DNA-binding transcriptional MerR regulator